MTVELLKEALPKQLHLNATQDMVDKINTMVEDPVQCEEIRKNFLTYSRVLAEGKFKLEDYLNAVKYASFKMMGYSNKEAYIKSFPDRYTSLVAKNASEKDISAYVAMYHKGKLVNMILEQATVPTWLLFQDITHKAIETQYKIMTDDEVSPKVRVEAANSILTHLKQPEVKKVEIDMSVKNEGGLGDLRDLMTQLAEQQLGAIQGGVPVGMIAAQKIGAPMPAVPQIPHGKAATYQGPTQVPMNSTKPPSPIEDAEYVEVKAGPEQKPEPTRGVSLFDCEMEE